LDAGGQRGFDIRGNSFSGGGVHNTSVTNRWGDIPNRDWRTTLGFRLALVASGKRQRGFDSNSWREAPVCDVRPAIAA
jgi:hypothetical protein